MAASAIMLCGLLLAACNPVNLRGGLAVGIFDGSPRTENSTGAFRGGPMGRVISVATSADGSRIYAGADHAGLWRSDDMGVSWQQMEQPQPGDGAAVCPAGWKPTSGCRLGSQTIRSIAVSPTDPDLVFVGTVNDQHSPERDGVYRTEDGGVTWELVFQQQCKTGGLPGVTNQPIEQVLFAPDDPTKLWASAGCGVAYSTVGGIPPSAPPTSGADPTAIGARGTWRVNMQPSVAYRIAVGPRTQDGRRSVWACGDNSGARLWRATDGGTSFTDMSTVLTGASALSQLICWTPSAAADNRRRHEAMISSSQAMTVDPAHPDRLYALAWGNNGYQFRHCGGSGEAGCPQSGVDHVVSPCTDSYCGPTILQIDADTATVRALSSPPRTGEGSNEAPAGSGEVTLAGQAQPDGRFLLFMGNGAYFASAVAPATSPYAWHRLDGPDPGDQCTLVNPATLAATCSSNNFDHRENHTLPTDVLHPDSHAFTVSPNFSMNLTTSAVTPWNAALGNCAGTGVMVQTDDGGLATSTDCGRNWTLAKGLSTNPGGGLGGYSRGGGKQPILWVGGRDDDAWLSNNGGQDWTLAGTCGDCQGALVDQLGGVIAHHNRGPSITTWNVPATGTFGPGAPGGHTYTFPSDVEGSVGADWTKGYRYLVQTVPGENPVPFGDVVGVDNDSTGTYVIRAAGGGSFHRVGPALPAGVRAVLQTSGGHTGTLFWVGSRGPDFASSESDQLYVADRPDSPTRWICVVPGYDPLTGGCKQPADAADAPCPADQACHAYRFFADPYDSQVAYILDANGVKETLDGGATWHLQPELTTKVLADGASPPHCKGNCVYDDDDSPLRSMVFVPGEPGTRFAVGVNGVFMTLSANPGTTGGGTALTEHWHQLLDPTSTPCLATSGFFDPAGPYGRALYVGCTQRGVLGILQIPAPGDRNSLDTGPTPTNTWPTTPPHA
ncbi:WD40/YVTN/BNR-like repeat-containing protein [Actinacidiphila acididurans]|uniref:Exo-alpha-sialidase n=1 Tax=Actinacidiphila acididurans TaxID=2784346 RepID=A0ABS2TV35_9ACTN|nr:hypothetical protein [Actinacidiphila acididurans]MBM9506677.1 hypothetical protein [Actinacidiphila acididurans]